MKKFTKYLSNTCVITVVFMGGTVVKIVNSDHKLNTTEMIFMP